MHRVIREEYCELVMKMKRGNNPNGSICGFESDPAQRSQYPDR